MVDLGGSQAEGLRMRAEALMQCGELPRHRPKVVKAGLGNGAHCHLCHKTIGESELRYLVELPSTVLRLHVDCFLVWEIVSEREP